MLARHLLGGFRDLWSKPAVSPDSAYEDVVGKGLDFYDGLAVPSITGIPGGRFLMAGWMGIRGWGGPLVDTEIAGQRTMVSCRPELTVRKMVFRTQGVELKNVQIATLKN
jgi:hypothetical protein